MVCGFTIQYAVADTGAGAYCVNGSSPKFQECNFMFCTAESRGGGLCFNAASPVLRGCSVSRNTASDAGRVDGYGGGIACLAGSAPLIADTRFEENDALKSGGGLESRYSSPSLVGCEFVANECGEYGHGGGARFQQSHGATLTGCVFNGNGVATCVGGGVHVSSSTIGLTDCDFIDNVSGASGGLHLTDSATATVSGCTFTGNVGSWNAAGGMQRVLSADAVVSNCTFVGNATHHVWCDGTSPTLEYCMLAFSDAGAAVYCETGTEAPSIHHCFVYGNAGVDALCGGNEHDIEYADPLLCDFEFGDVTLCADSPCLPGVTWGSLVGAESEGCAACGSAVEHRTWGSIKAEHR